MFRTLNPQKTVETIALLGKRIHERFPTAGLNKVCAELLTLAEENQGRANWIARPYIAIRIGVVLVIALAMLVLFYSISHLSFTREQFSIGELVTVSEAGINDIVLLGAAIFFLITLETRIKRSRALAALHELRCIAHVIDMHQLTKDPSQLLNKVVMTPSSPERVLTAFELTRYLDYCSEMLSLTGKLAALYAQGFRDAVVLSAVNEVENLTTGLSRKIWQKIMILRQFDQIDG